MRPAFGHSRCRDDDHRAMARVERLGRCGVARELEPLEVEQVVDRVHQFFARSYASGFVANTVVAAIASGLSSTIGIAGIAFARVSR